MHACMKFGLEFEIKLINFRLMEYFESSILYIFTIDRILYILLIFYNILDICIYIYIYKLYKVIPAGIYIYTGTKYEKCLSCRDIFFFSSFF